MKKKPALLPRATSEKERLQKERAEITSRLSSTTVLIGTLDRQALAMRLVEVKRALNRLYAAQQ